jgi:transglutaminase-like putative cysteine protease
VDRRDERAVVRAIYGFVVTHTRYVALEFGIHSFKPYRVDRVLSRRFGDCKDKASLIHTMLKVAGVESKIVLLRMRHLGKIDEQPASLAAGSHKNADLTPTVVTHAAGATQCDAFVPLLGEVRQHIWPAPQFACDVQASAVGEPPPSSTGQAWPFEHAA